jgi:hypothetical protein
MKTLKLILAIAFVSVFTGCANDDDYSTPDLSGECVDLAPNKEVADVLALSTNVKQQYTADDIIEAYVTSSDEGGNFYKSISFVSTDGTKAFSMPVDAYNLYNLYEPGRKVYIHLKDLYFMTDFNSTIIGQLYNNDTPDNPADDEVGRISGIQYENILTRSCTKVNEDELVNHITIAQAMHDEYLNKLIEFDSVQFTDESRGAKYFDEALPSPGGATNHQIVDKFGTKVILRVSQYATYAGNVTPSGNGKIRGVMTKFNSDYQFMTRTLNDIKLINPRITDDPVVDPGEGGGPSPDAVIAFPGGDFENYPAFLAGINSFGIKSYATQGTGAGMDGSASLHIAMASTPANDYVFTSFPNTGLPAAPTKMHFYIKGTASKTVSINIYKNDGVAYTVFNLDDVTVDKTISPGVSNQYIGTINTGGEWRLITLDLSTLTVNDDINLTHPSLNFFALKVGKEAPYDLQFDNFTIE